MYDAGLVFAAQQRLSVNLTQACMPPSCWIVWIASLGGSCLYLQLNFDVWLLNPMSNFSIVVLDA